MSPGTFLKFKNFVISSDNFLTLQIHRHIYSQLLPFGGCLWFIVRVEVRVCVRVKVRVRFCVRVRVRG